MTSRAGARARYALAAVRAARDQGEETAGKFRRWVETVPALLRTNGLGQTMAYLRAKAADDPGAREIYRVFLVWLQSPGQFDPERPLPASGEDVIAAIRATSRGGRPRTARERRADYRSASEAAWALCEWLKPLALTYLRKAEEPR